MECADRKMECAQDLQEGTAPAQNVMSADANSAVGESATDRVVVEGGGTKGRLDQDPVRVLTVGDGDLSFSLALMRCYGGSLQQDGTRMPHSMALVATVLPPLEEVRRTYTRAGVCIDELIRRGALVRDGVDATDIVASLAQHANDTAPFDDQHPHDTARFHHIYFNHPHLGLCDLSETEAHARRHAVLVAHFIAAAARVLTPRGQVHLTLCGRQRLAWRVDEAAARNGMVVAAELGVTSLHPLGGLPPTNAAPPVEWGARRRFRSGALGCRHALAPFGYEHRRTAGDVDMRVDKSVEIVLELAPAPSDAASSTAALGTSVAVEPEALLSSADQDLLCSVCGFSFDSAEEAATHVTNLAVPDAIQLPDTNPVITTAATGPATATTTTAAATDPATATTTAAAPPAAATHACAICGTEFASRNRLFAHLSSTCEPRIVALDHRHARHTRILLLLGYVLPARADADSYATVIDEELLTLLQSAWPATTAVAAPCLTERGVHARCNPFVVSVRSHHGCDEAALRALLPSHIALLAPIAPVRAGSPFDDFRRSVKRQTYKYALPYAALASLVDGGNDSAGGGGGGDGADGTTGVHGVWLAGLPDDCGAADVSAFVSSFSISAAAVSFPSCGGFAQLDFASGAAADACALALDGVAWRDSTLLAMHAGEATRKLAVHSRVKTLLRRLSTGRGARSYHNFASAKWHSRNARAVRCVPHGHSSVQDDWRVGSCAEDTASLSDAASAPAWVRSHWLVLRFSAREFMSQQVRRMVGVLLCAVRTARDEASQCGADTQTRVAAIRISLLAVIDSFFCEALRPTPVAPAENMWLEDVQLTRPRRASAQMEMRIDTAKVSEVADAIRREIVGKSRERLMRFFTELGEWSAAPEIRHFEPAADANVPFRDAAAGKRLDATTARVLHAGTPVSPARWRTDRISVDGSDAYLALVTEQTTGGHVWDASRVMLECLEAKQEELFGGGRVRVLELGAGTGWLGMTLALNAAPLLCRVHLTEMEHANALKWLEHNVSANSAAFSPRDSGETAGGGAQATVERGMHATADSGLLISAGACDWDWWAGGTSCVATGTGDWADLARARLETERWDLVLGADLVYNEGGAAALPRVLRALAQPHTTVLYAHTLLRFEHFDDLFFKGLQEAGLEYKQVWPELLAAEINQVVDSDSQPFTELFPEMRVVVFRISQTRASP